MLTKEQKTEQVALTVNLTKKSKNLIFADFSKVSDENIKKLRQDLKKAGAKFKVVKKRLLKLALKEAGVDYDPMQFESQVGTIFVPNEMTSVAGSVYKLEKDLTKKQAGFKVMGAYDVAEKSPLTAEEFMVIAKLPSREVLLAQVIGGVTGPLRAFMYLLSELAKRAPQPATEPQSQPTSTADEAATTDKVE